MPCEFLRKNRISGKIHLGYFKGKQRITAMWTENIARQHKQVPGQCKILSLILDTKTKTNMRAHTHTLKNKITKQNKKITICEKSCCKRKVVTPNIQECYSGLPC